MKTLVDILEEGRKRYSSEPAFKIKPRYRSVVWDYNEFYNCASGVAKLLEEHKLKKGGRILLWAANSPYWLAVFFGCLLKGIIVVPLHLQNRPEFILKIAKQTQTKLLFKTSAIKKPKELGIESINIDYLDDFAQKEWTFKRPLIQENDAAEILYTSGTTGFPKGVVLTHKNIVSDLKAIFEMIEVRKSDRLLSILPLSHIFEQIVDFRALVSGAQIVFAPALASSIITGTLFENKITKMAVVPEFLKLVMQRIEAEARNQGKEKKLKLLFKLSPYLARSLRKTLAKNIHQKFGGKLDLIVSGGAPLEVGVAKKWQALGINILQGYGLTETSPVISVLREKDKELASVGKVIPGVRVKIAKDDEVLVKGPIVFKGYWRDPKKTKAVFEQGWFKTGDTGYFDKDGFLYIKGRKKFIILTAAGQNVYPEDIEFELNKEKEVIDSCVVGVKIGERILLQAVLLSETKNLEKVINKVNKRLASFQQIQKWSVWPFADFPRTITRKIKKTEVLDYLTREIVPEGVKLAQKEIPPLIEILSTITNTNPALISLKTRIVKDLQLDSLMRIELVAQIEEEFGVEIDEAQITPKTRVQDLESLIKKQPKREIKHKLSSWQINPLTGIIRKILTRALVFPLFASFCQFKIEGEENLEQVQGPVIFMPNHISSLDGLSVVRVLPSRFQNRIALATATDILYEKFKPLQKIITLLLNSYPFPRVGQIKSGLEYTGKLLDKDWSILLFPEGRESPTGRPLPLKEGAGVIALEMQVPIIPVKIQGTGRILPHGSHFPKKRGQIAVKLGRPLYFQKGIEPKRITKMIEKAMKAL